MKIDYDMPKAWGTYPGLEIPNQKTSSKNPITRYMKLCSVFVIIFLDTLNYSNSHVSLMDQDRQGIIFVLLLKC